MVRIRFPPAASPLRTRLSSVERRRRATAVLRQSRPDPARDTNQNFARKRRLHRRKLGRQRWAARFSRKGRACVVGVEQAARPDGRNVPLGYDRRIGALLRWSVRRIRSRLSGALTLASNKVVARQLGISFLFDRLFVYVVARIVRRANGAVFLRNVK